MTRQEFMRNCAAASLGMPFLPTVLASCKANEFSIGRRFDTNFDGNVLIIGAGSAGLMAGHVLNQHNIDFQIIEASSRFGGRVMEIEGFADFPIDLGAEWLHDDPSTLAELINDPDADAAIDLIVYRPETFRVWRNDKLRKRNFISNFYSEFKFKSTTWYDFFDRFIVPGISNRIVYDSPAQSINYSSDRVVVTNTNGQTFEADKIILTVPLTTLKQGLIDFEPPLPTDKVDALDDVEMPDGIKIFVEMSERFYPDITFAGNLIENLVADDGQKIIYDAAYRKDSNSNVLALFTVGEPASAYTSQGAEEAIINYFMDELDTIFDGKASKYYLNHVVQNWSAEPFINGSYSHYQRYGSRDALIAPIDQKVFFAGETYAPESSIATVHGAGLSAYNAVEEILSQA